jgi:hypothetical protein
MKELQKEKDEKVIQQVGREMQMAKLEKFILTMLFEAPNLASCLASNQSNQNFNTILSMI